MAFDLRKERFGTFAYFVEEGTVVGENTVGIDFFPDATEDSEFWNSMGCVLQSNLEPIVETTDPDYCPSPSGGYDKEEEEIVVGDILKLSLKCHFEIIHRLIWGLKNKAVNGTPASPFRQKNRKVRGWINIQLRAEDGTDRVLSVLWVEMRLDANPVWSKDFTKPAVKCKRITSPIDAFEPANIADIAA